MEPAYARLLIWPERRVQLAAHVDTGEIIRVSKVFQNAGQPRPGRNAGPLLCFFIRCLAAGSVRSREQTHRVPETQAAFRCGLFRHSKLIDEPGEFIPIDLHPTSSDKMQSAWTGEQARDFVFSQCLAVERDLHLEIEKRLDA